MFSAPFDIAKNVNLGHDYILAAEDYADTSHWFFDAGNYKATADQFPQWNKGDGKVMKGLVRRRAAERELFLKK